MRNKKEYLEYKEQLRKTRFTPRENCSVCGFAKKTCYCHLVKSFDPKITFVILIHQIEIDRKIATGTMSHLILKNSYLVPGFDYTHDKVVNKLIENPENHCVVLYPGKYALNLSKLTSIEQRSIVSAGKKLVIFVVDGTWNTARQTMYKSKNLQKLPQISFTVNSPSNFRIRKQPSIECCSTAEAIYKTICLLGDSQGFNTNSCAHNNLLEVFDHIVDTQISLKKHRIESIS